MINAIRRLGAVSVLWCALLLAPAALRAESPFKLYAPTSVGNCPTNWDYTADWCADDETRDDFKDGLASSFDAWWEGRPAVIWPTELSGYAAACDDIFQAGLDYIESITVVATNIRNAAGDTIGGYTGYGIGGDGAISISGYGGFTWDEIVFHEGFHSVGASCPYGSEFPCFDANHVAYIDEWHDFCYDPDFNDPPSWW